MGQSSFWDLALEIETDFEQILDKFESIKKVQL